MAAEAKGSWFAMPKLNPPPGQRHEVLDCLPDLNLFARKIFSPTAPSTPHPTPWLILWTVGLNTWQTGPGTLVDLPQATTP